jgi:hypothetical protein
MAKPRQIVHVDRKDDGVIEVNCEPIVVGDIEAKWVDSAGVGHIGFKTEEELRGVANVPDEYDCVSFKPNTWPIQIKGKPPMVAHQAKGTFMPPKPGKFVIDNLLEELKANSPMVPRIHKPRQQKDPKRMLEISIMDPHVGLQCYKPESDANYDLDIARDLYLWAVNELAALGTGYGDIDEILFPIGNDFLHAEPAVLRGKGEGHATSGGTVQPEMVSWYHSYISGEQMLREAITYLSEIAPVTVLQIPGNHDKTSSFTLGRVMNAFFYNNDNVTVDCSPDPYKFKEYGCNLIGFEHGHHVAQVRLAALMANMMPDAWARTAGGYREWHLGDQHRKGSAKPSMLEEQGVSVEFLPSMTAPNAWHHMKSFNFQKRGAMGWVWDHDLGPIARIQVNLNSYTGLPRS